MICPKCGKQFPDSIQFCYDCGTKLVLNSHTTGYQQGYAQPQQPYQQTYQQSYQQPQQGYQPPVGGQKTLTRSEFYDQFASGGVKTICILKAASCFLGAVVGFILLICGNVFGLVDFLVFAALGGLLMITKHWGVAAASVAYSGFAFILNLVIYGFGVSVLPLALSIFAFLALRKVDQAYQEYLQRGIYPDRPIAF